MHLRTLREVPNEAEIPSHILLLRTGMIRKLVSGVYGFMPLGWRSVRKIEEITRREMAGFTDPRIREVRIMGGCVCVEVYDSAVLKGYQEYAYKRGVFSRPFLNYLYAMVPYVIKEEELIQVLQCMKDWFAR